MGKPSILQKSRPLDLRPDKQLCEIVGHLGRSKDDLTAIAEGILMALTEDEQWARDLIHLLLDRLRLEADVVGQQCAAAWELYKTLLAEREGVA